MTVHGLQTPRNLEPCPVDEPPCAKQPHLFFSNTGETYSRQNQWVQLAIVVCEGCPGVDACQAWGDRVEEGEPRGRLDGILAAETPIERWERRRLRRPNPTNETCINGHEWTPTNTIITTRGWRQCRACKAAFAARNRERLNADRRARRAQKVAA